MSILLDTHVVVWLYAGLVDRFPPPVQLRLEENALEASAVVTLELRFLQETGRIRARPDEIVAELGRRIGLRIASADLADVVARADSLAWTCDPFDRLIAGHALVADRCLLTKDRTLRANLELARWD